MRMIGVVLANTENVASWPRNRRAYLDLRNGKARPFAGDAGMFAPRPVDQIEHGFSYVIAERPDTLLIKSNYCNLPKPVGLNRR